MTYQTATEFKDRLIHLEGTQLLKSTEWVINKIIILPENNDSRLIYTGHVTMRYPEWMATGFDHEVIYRQSGLYYLSTGGVADDDLTLFALLKNKKTNTEAEYKAELLYNLVIAGEVVIEDNPDLLLHHP